MKILIATLFAFCSLLFCSLDGQAQSISGVVNDYTPVLSINSCEITVASSTGFNIGDKVMIIQMKGADIDTSNAPSFGQIIAYDDCGNYEWKRITDITGTLITLNSILMNTYTITGLVQLIRVPEYTNASIDGILTCQPWNGTTGGVLAFIDFGITTFNANANVDFLGFRGNTVQPTGYANCSASYREDDATIESKKGEGIYELPLTMTRGLGRNGNGGGGGRTDNGGGGASNFGAGGLGGNFGWSQGCAVQALGGMSLTYSNADNKIFLGGAGGDAQNSEGTGTNFGENGGGIVIFRSNEVVGNGFSISSQGQDALDVPQDGGGGGGAGGVVLIDCPTYSTPLNINTSGGDGGDANTYLMVECSGGGGGGGGALWVSTAAINGNITYTSNGGLGGLSASTVDGLPGQAGGSITNLIIHEETLGSVTVDAGVDQTVCEGDTITLTALNPDGALLAWTGGVTDGIPFISSSGVNTYYVTASPGPGSCAGIGGTMDSVTVTVNPLATVGAGLDTLVCLGSLATLTAFNPDGAAITWSGGIMDGTAFPALPGVNTYVVTAILAGCTSTDDVEVGEHLIPVMDVISDVEACAQDNVTIPVFTSSLLGDHYAWTNLTGIDVGFGLSGNDDIAGFVGINSGTTDFTVTVEVTLISENGCEGAPTTFDVTIHPLPTPNISPNAMGCAPLSVVFMEDGDGTTGSCFWDFGDGSTAMSCDSAFHTFTEEGIYDVSFTTTTIHGCSATVTEPGLVIVTADVDAHFTFAPQSITVEDTEVAFINSSTDASAFNWDFADGSPLNSETNPTHTFPENGAGEYLVTLTASNGANGCSDTYQQLIVIEDVIIFYVPNIFTPDGDEYNQVFEPVITSGIDVYDYHFTIFNRWGEIVFESFNKNFGWDGTYGDRGPAEDGVYVWKIEFGDTRSDKKHEHYGHVTVLR